VTKFLASLFESVIPIWRPRHTPNAVRVPFSGLFESVVVSCLLVWFCSIVVLENSCELHRRWLWDRI